MVDATPIGLPDEIYPPEGKRQSLTSLRFQNWPAAEQFLLKNGADPAALREMWEALKGVGIAVLTIPSWTPADFAK